MILFPSCSFFTSLEFVFFLDLFGVYKVGGNPDKTEEYEIIVGGDSVSFTSLIFLMSILGIRKEETRFVRLREKVSNRGLKLYVHSK